MVEGLHPRLVGEGQLAVARSEQHRGPVVVAVPGELGGQAGLAGAGLASDQDDAPATGCHLRPARLEDAPLLGATDEPDPGGDGERGRKGDRGEGVARRAFLGRRIPADGEDLDRFRECPSAHADPRGS